MTSADAHDKEDKKDNPTPPGHLVIQVHDEDAGGPPLTVDGGPGEKVSKMVEVVCT